MFAKNNNGNFTFEEFNKLINYLTMKQQKREQLVAIDKRNDFKITPVQIETHNESQ